jgi:hypothetical protein
MKDFIDFVVQILELYLFLKKLKRRNIMEEKIIEMAAAQGTWALLSIVLIFYILKTQEKRDLRQEEREKSYQDIISSLTDKLNLVKDVKGDVTQIKDSLINIKKI